MTHHGGSAVRKRVATVDIGTNSVLLLVAERREDGEVVPLLERATITRLGQGVDRTRTLSPDAVERTLACLREYAVDARALGVTRIVAVGTSAMRDAKGGEAFREEASALLGEAPRVVSGEEEARLTFTGSLAGLSRQGEVTVFDVGGGSTEVVSGTWSEGRATVDSAVSLDVGSVRLTERHVQSDPIPAAELARVNADVDAALSSVAPCRGALVAVAGTATTLAAHALGVAPYDASRIHGATLSRSDVERAVAELARMPLAERKLLPTIEPKRADVIVAGGCIVARVLAWAGVGEVVISDRGVRWGLAIEALSIHLSAKNQRFQRVAPKAPRCRLFVDTLEGGH